MIISSDYIFDLTVGTESPETNYIEIFDEELFPNEIDDNGKTVENNDDSLTMKSYKTFKLTFIKNNDKKADKQKKDRKKEIYICIELAKRETSEEVEMLF